MSRVAKPKAVPTCALTIDHYTYLLPLADGMKVMEIMQRSFVCSLDYTRDVGHVYTPRSQPSVEMSVVRPNQVRQPLGPAAPGTKAVEFNPSEIL